MGEKYEEKSAVLKAMAHPVRLKLIEGLMMNECNVSVIVENLKLPQSTVSQHLKILKEAGLVQGEIDGPRVCYCINPASLAELKELIAKL